MGKLILGILFVILLQVVFFGYTSRYWSTSTEVAVAPLVTKPVPQPLPLQPSSPLPPPTEQTGELVSPDAPIEDTVVRKSVRPPVTSARVELPPAKRATPKYSGLRRIHTTPWKTTVITIKNEPASDTIAAAAPRNFVTAPEESFVAKTRRLADAAPRRKKRTILGKTYSIVVKKPWGWMKSVASKLD